MADEERDAPWISFGGERRPQAALRERAARGAACLRAFGLRDGDAVALLLGNGFTIVEAQMAAAQAGAFPVPLNPAADPDVIGFILRDCAARVLVAETRLLDTVRPGVPSPVTVIPAEDWDDWIARYPPVAEPSPASRGAIIYTSGTTGRPKGVRREPPPPGTRPTRALQVYGFDRPDQATALVDGPLSHAVPNAYLRIAMGAGANVVLRSHFDAAATLDAIEQDRVSHLHLVPAAMARLLALPEEIRRSRNLSSLRHVVHGAAPCPPHLKRALIDWWGPVVHEYYGSSETGLVAFHDPAEARAKPGTVGRALPGIAIRILDPEGRDLPSGSIGRVFAGSDTLHAFTYLGDPERRAAMGRGDLVTAGDLGWLDAEGDLFLAGREADVIRIGDGSVHPAMVEAALAVEAGVADCAVLGLPGGDGPEIFVACIEPVAGAVLDRARLTAVLAAALPGGAPPGRIEIVENLPRQSSGKLSKVRVRQMMMEPSAQPTGADPRLASFGDDREPVAACRDGARVERSAG